VVSLFLGLKEDWVLVLTVLPAKKVLQSKPLNQWNQALSWRWRRIVYWLEP
jgi:hypothetical protein